MTRPLIGLTPSLNMEDRWERIRPAYTDSVLAAGGLPVLLPLTEEESVMRELLARCAGILLTGGPDVDPARYGAEDPDGLAELCPPRDILEFRLTELALAADKPLLAICRGVQVLNVALGGDLWIDLPSQRPSPVAHRQAAPGSEATHGVRVLPDTPLQALCGRDELRVNSLHHQAIRTLAPALELMAEAEDGLPEAAWLPGKRFVFGVQWHPEILSARDEPSRAIFRRFAEACGE